MQRASPAVGHQSASELLAHPFCATIIDAILSQVPVPGRMRGCLTGGCIFGGYAPVDVKQWQYDDGERQQQQQYQQKHVIVGGLLPIAF